VGDLVCVVPGYACEALLGCFQLAIGHCVVLVLNDRLSAAKRNHWFWFSIWGCKGRNRLSVGWRPLVRYASYELTIGSVTLSTGHPIHILIRYFSTAVYCQLHSVLSLFFLHPDTSHFMLISSSSAQFSCYSLRISNNTGFWNFDRMHPYRKCWVQTYSIAIMLGALSPYQCLRRIEFFRRLSSCSWLYHAFAVLWWAWIGFYDVQVRSWIRHGIPSYPHRVKRWIVAA